jgi:MFS family permease
VRRSIGGGTGLVQWLSASYTLALAVLLITGGRLGDRYGQRRMFLLGAAGFTAASVACGLSVTPGTLIAARLVQGSFGAVLLPQGIGLLTAAFPAKDLGKAFSAYAPVLSTILAGITPAETGSASGSLGAIQQLAGSIGVATIATLYTAASHPAARGLVVTALATAGVLAAGPRSPCSCRQRAT